ncbi:MAG: hypothetical protein Q8N44_22580 [Rubrivivax sp.]|nr:hypothetical protein [Rubrivivax sp.]
MAQASAAGMGWLGAWLSRYLSQPSSGDGTVGLPTDPALLQACLQPGDVLLVEGQSRISVAIKYLTQTTWSHAALHVGAGAGLVDARGRPCSFIEADVEHGVRAVGLDEYAGLHTRVCRPVGLDAPRSTPCSATRWRGWGCTTT